MDENGNWVTDNVAGNLITHAILGAVVAELQGNSGLVGGAGAVGGELAADIIRKQLYGKDVKDLTEEDKRTISALAQLATGLAIAVAGGDVGDAGTAIAAGKNAVENNGLSWTDGGFGGDFIGLSPETGANYDGILHASAAGYLTPEETIQLIDDINSGRFMYDPLRDDLKRLPEDIAILTTPYGDYIAFRDAETWGDYAIAAVGTLPFAKYIKVAGKVVKIETKAGQALVKEAEKAYHSGDIATGNQLMNQAASHGTTVETTVVRNSGAGKGTNSAQGLVGKDFENYLNQTLGGKGSFTYNGREFDGAYGKNNSILYEAKSGRYWQDHAQAGSKGFEKFKSDVGFHASIAKQNGASFEVHSNTPIPQHVKDWLTSKNIPFKEY